MADDDHPVCPQTLDLTDRPLSAILVPVPFPALFVCTGNICRSPMAELLFRAWADPRAQLAASSAGTQALVGHGIDRGSASALGQLGIDPTAHRAQQFQPWMAADADLILTAERAHRDLVMTACPSAWRRTFTIKEFARLAPYVEGDDPLSVIKSAATNRGLVGGVPLDEDDVVDPYRNGINHAKEIAADLTQSVNTALGMLGLLAHAGARRRPVPYAH